MTMRDINQEKIIQSRENKLRDLSSKLKSIGVSVTDFFQFLRVKWIKDNIKGSYIHYIERVLGNSVNEIIELKLHFISKR